MMEALYAIVLSGILYRVPRGGPDQPWWRVTFGIERAHGARVWAIASGIMLSVAAGLWWAAPAVALALWLGQKPAWMRWAAPSDGSAPKVLPLALRGLLLLNPLMGVWYALAFRYRDRLPTWGVVMDGWTAFAELACGLTVATAWFVLLAFVSTII